MKKAVMFAAGIVTIAGTALATVIFDQNFDDTGVFTTSTTGYAGDDLTTSGRWGPFDSSGGIQNTISTDQAYSGTQSLKITRTAYEANNDIVVRRNGTSFADPIGRGASSQKNFSLRLQIYRVDDATFDPAQLYILWGTTEDAFSVSAGMGINAAGRLEQNISGSWTEMGTDTVSLNTWTELRWDYQLNPLGSPTPGQVTAYINGTAVNTATLSYFADAVDRVKIMASFGNAQSSYIDDFQIIPEPASLGLMGISALALWFVRRKAR